MRRRICFLLAGMLFAASASATVTYTWAPVGDPGNTADTRYNSISVGNVATPFLISTTEVTNSQWVEFLNTKDPTGANTLGLYNSNQTTHPQVSGIDFTAGNPNGSKYSVQSGRGNVPVCHVSFFDSLRFANWLNNGQGSGDTETGAYTLLGGTPTPSNGDTVSRNLGAVVFLPSENEWYKAAYYKGGGTNAGYWDYATQTNTVPISDQPPGAFAPSNSANFYLDDGDVGNGYNDGFATSGTPSGPAPLTDVGAYTGSVSAYGTFDQMGSVWEFNETLITGTFRGFRGGSWLSGDNAIHANLQGYAPADGEYQFAGLRVASLIPEPSGTALIITVAAALLRRKRVG